MRCVSLLLVALFPAVSAAQTVAVEVLVAYYSETGNTEKMAQAAAEGVRSVEGAEARVRRIEEVTKEELERADGILLGSPVHMAGAAAPVRQAVVAWSMDYGFWSSRALMNKVGAVFATGHAPSNGKEFTMMSLALTLLQYGVVFVSPYGSLGASATTGVPESDKGVNEHELVIARDLGARVARVAAQMKQGARAQ